MTEMVVIPYSAQPSEKCKWWTLFYNSLLFWVLPLFLVYSVLLLVLYKKNKRKHFTSNDSSIPNVEFLTPEIGNMWNEFKTLRSGMECTLKINDGVLVTLQICEEWRRAV
jgi:hypothetical protein